MLAAALALVPVLANFIPDIAKWLGGDDAERVAGQVVAVAQSVAGSTDPAVVAAMVEDPQRGADLALGLAKIAADREKARDAAMLDSLKASIAGVQDARNYNADLVRTGSKLAYAPIVISALVLVGFFSVVMAIFFVDKRWDERTITVLNSIFGTLTAAFGATIQYWLGSARENAVREDRQQQALTLATDTARRVMDTAPVLAAAAATSAAASATAEATRPLFNRN